MKLNIISTLCVFLSIATVQAQLPTENNCTVFTWDQQPAYFKLGTPERISAAATCASRNSNNQSQYCALTAEGDIQATSSRNVSQLTNNCWNAPTGYTCYLQNIVQAAVNTSLNGEGFNNSVIGAIDTTVALEPGTSAYLNFTTLKRCYVGTLSNCTGVLTDGIVLEVCAPVYHTVGTNRKAIMDGQVIVVNISEADVGKYKDPFANQSSGEGSDAGRFLVAGNVMALALLITFTAALL